MTFQNLLVIISCFAATLGQQLHPVSFKLPPPPSLTGPLTPNSVLYTAETLHNRVIVGTVSFAFLNGDVFAVTADSKVVNIARCNPTLIADFKPRSCNTAATCGFLTSIRVGINGQLLVVDAYKGLYELNATTGAIKQLYSSATPVGGRSPVFLNDAVQAADGTIYLTDSSDKYNAQNDLYIILEGRTSGRILALNPSTGAITEYIKDIFAYPNGLELTTDCKALLVSESGRARVLRVSLVPGETPQATIFANNLPGCPTNIRRTNHGTFWVALSLIRHSGIANSMDQYSENPLARLRTSLTDTLQRIRSYYPNYGLVVELSPSGTIIGSLHDPRGWKYASVSEAAENEGLLYIANADTPFAGRVVLPEFGGRVLTADSQMQLQRSRCLITEAQYQSYIKNRSTTTATLTTACVASTTQAITTPGSSSSSAGVTESSSASSVTTSVAGVTQSSSVPHTHTSVAAVTESSSASSVTTSVAGVTQSSSVPHTHTSIAAVTESSSASSVTTSAAGVTESSSASSVTTSTTGVTETSSASSETTSTTGVTESSSASSETTSTTGVTETSTSVSP